MHVCRIHDRPNLNFSLCLCCCFHFVVQVSSLHGFLLPVCVSDCLSDCLPACLSFCLSACLPVCLFVYLPVYMSTNLVHVSTYLPSFLYMRLFKFSSVHPSICFASRVTSKLLFYQARYPRPPVCLSVCLSVSFVQHGQAKRNYASLWLNIWVSVCTHH